MPRRASIPVFLHRALLVLLMLGACLQPAMAAVCDVGDARVFASRHADAVASVDRAHAGDAGDCCADPACSDCCLHATAFPAQSAPVIASAMPALQPVPLATDFRSSDDPVDIRPPISG